MLCTFAVRLRRRHRQYKLFFLFTDKCSACNIANAIVQCVVVVVAGLFSNDSCLRSGDYIAVHDGTDVTANRLRLYCGDADDVSVTSSADRLLVQFVADDRSQAQGFSASFRYLHPSAAVRSPFHNTSSTGNVVFIARAVNKEWFGTSFTGPTFYVGLNVCRRPGVAEWTSFVEERSF